MSMIMIHNRRKGWNTITETYVTNIINKDDTGPDMLSGRTLLLLSIYWIYTRWLGPTPTKGTKWYWYTSTQDGLYHICRIYNTVNKGTGKRHITDEKPLILRCAFLHQYLILKPHYTRKPFKTILSHYTQQPFKNLVGYRLIFFYKYWSINVHHSFISFWGLVPTPKLISLAYYINIGIPLKTLIQNLVYDYLQHELK